MLKDQKILLWHPNLQNNMNSINKELPFQHLRVLDLSSVLAGPLTGSFFAELGATVVKVENKTTGGDATRQWKLPSEDPENPYSAYYHAANFGKEVIFIDLNSDEERKKLEEIMAQSDVVISNFQKKVAAKFDLLPDDIGKRHPHMIVAQLSAYEFDDPRPGYDLVMQGETGWISMTGTDKDHFAKLPVAMIDIIASHQMKEAILIGLLKKASSGKGSVVHVSLYKSALSALANQATNYLIAGHVPVPCGTLHPNIAPYGDVFTDVDGIKFLLAVGSDAQFKKLWFTLNLSEEEYHTFELNSGRLKNRNLLCKALQQSFETQHISELKDIFNVYNIPFCEIRSLDIVFSQEDSKSMLNQEKVGDELVTSVSSIAFTI